MNLVVFICLWLVSIVSIIVSFIYHFFILSLFNFPNGLGLRQVSLASQPGSLDQPRQAVRLP